MGQKIQKAKANGYYTQGRSQFKIRAGDPIPANIDGDVFYYEDNPQEETVGLAQRHLNEIAAEREETTEDAEAVETTADDEEVETAAKKPVSRTGKNK